jgi:hypothetical protein
MIFPCVKNLFLLLYLTVAWDFYFGSYLGISARVNQYPRWYLYLFVAVFLLLANFHQIWLKYFLDGHHIGYMAKSIKETLPLSVHIKHKKY